MSWPNVPVVLDHGSAGAGTSALTGSFTSHPNSTVVLFALIRNPSVNAALPTLTDNAGQTLAWTNRQSKVDANINGRLAMWTAPGDGSTGTVTIDEGAESETSFWWCVVELPNTVDFVAAANLTNQNAATSGSVVGSAPAKASNVTLGFISHAANEAGTSGESALTDDRGGNVGNHDITVGYKSPGQTVVSASWASSVKWRGIQAEFKTRDTAEVVTVAG